MQLWTCGAAGAALACAASLDVRALPSAAAVQLLCLAASPDGQMLAAGDSSGSVHLFSLALAATPYHLCSAAAHSGSGVTALAFGPATSAGLLLAAGSRRGTVALMRCQPGSGSCALLATLADHKAAVTGLLFSGSSDSSGTATLTTAGAERLTYSCDAATGQAQLQARADAPQRCGFVGLALALVGQASVAVAASSAGRISWEAGGAETIAQVLDKRQGKPWAGRQRLWGALHAAGGSKLPPIMPAVPPLPDHCPLAGELASFAVDASLSLLVCATTRQQLLVHRLAGGKAALVATCQAHAAGCTVTKVGVGWAGAGAAVC